jgi:hypothetical protein
MEKEFVPYELAVKLKTLGYDGPCFGVYIAGHLMITYDSIYNSTDIPVVKAPTFSQAFKWFREKYGHWSYIKEATKGTCRFYIEKFDEKFFNSETYKTYGEAELSCLEKLIEIVEQK